MLPLETLPPTLAELRAAAYAAARIRDTIAAAAGFNFCFPAEVTDPQAVAFLTAAKAAAKVEIDRYLSALAEAQRNPPSKPRAPRKRKAAKPAPKACNG